MWPLPHHHAGGARERVGPLPRGLLRVPPPVQWGARRAPSGGWLHLPRHPPPAPIYLEKQEARLKEAGVFRRVRLSHLLLLAGDPRHQQPLLLRVPGLRRALQFLHAPGPAPCQSLSAGVGLVFRWNFTQNQNMLVSGFKGQGLNFLQRHLFNALEISIVFKAIGLTTKWEQSLVILRPNLSWPLKTVLLLLAKF